MLQYVRPEFLSFERCFGTLWHLQERQKAVSIQLIYRFCHPKKSSATLKKASLSFCNVYTLPRRVQKRGKNRCRDPGLNRGPLDLQSSALPTELSRRGYKAEKRIPSYVSERTGSSLLFINSFHCDLACKQEAQLQSIPNLSMPVATAFSSA
jgi:hypothetical protein